MMLWNGHMPASYTKAMTVRMLNEDKRKQKTKISFINGVAVWGLESQHKTSGYRYGKLIKLRFISLKLKNRNRQGFK